MVAGSVSNEVLSQVAPERLWKAIVKDSPSLMPKLLPELVSSIVILEGDGGVGTIRQSNFTSGNTLYIGRISISRFGFNLGPTSRMQLMINYSVIEGGLIGKKVKSTSFELKFEPATDGGSVCKLNAEFESMEDGLPTEEVTKEIMGGMTGMFKAIEGYLLANPEAYA
ncbi:major pollen allergen Bet v 1-F/I [Cinnamomum micranthum f. kanehirae]|uniref:Major pollen allergen Bet v 1-F/I n=1 Tax=Cinnamomum micranthum f. kanehirae TaxID=337451 RepID=A0A3S5WGH9_9MAGN|nr:major pollen allergen Bet v 1-F/I [Cinnamomum micranthum f. kanehirae]